jgi:hypothetical protein
VPGDGVAQGLQVDMPAGDGGLGRGDGSGLRAAAEGRELARCVDDGGQPEFACEQFLEGDGACAGVGTGAGA